MNKQLEMFEPQDLEQKFKYILLQKTAIQITGNWKPILEREVRALCPWGIKKVIAGVYDYTYSTPAKILHQGYTLLRDTSQAVDNQREIAQFSVKDLRMKTIKPPESNNIIPEYL